MMRWSEVAQLCLTRCDPMDCSLPDSSIHVHGKISRQDYWSGLPFPSPGDLPNLGIKPRSPTSQADSLPSVTREALLFHSIHLLISTLTIYMCFSFHVYRGGAFCSDYVRNSHWLPGEFYEYWSGEAISWDWLSAPNFPLAQYEWVNGSPNKSRLDILRRCSD